LAASRVLVERYEMHRRIGRGAMGEVWAATDLTTGSDVAVKLAQQWMTTDPELMGRFEREGKLLRRIRSPYVCSLIDAGRTDKGIAFMVIERLTGETFEALLAREGYLSVAEAARVVDDVLQALVAAHNEGVVHRDLSAANVFLHRLPDGGTITKVLDFGVAKVADTTGQRTGKRSIIGSLPYIAPEQLDDSARVGPKADLYAVGTLLFRAITGKMPFGDAEGMRLVVLKREHDPPSIDEVTGEKWPVAIRSFVTKMTSRALSKRPASAEVALHQLRAALAGPGPRIDLPPVPEDATATLTVSGSRGASSGRPPSKRSR